MSRPAKPRRALNAEQRQLVSDNLGLAYKQALKFAAKDGKDPDDYISNALLALMDAAIGYQKERAKFSTYATLAVISRLTNTRVRRMRQLSRFRNRPDFVLDEYRDRRRLPEAPQETKELYDIAMSVLKQSERIVIVLRTINGMKLHQVAEILGVHKEWVRQLEKRGLARCRMALSGELPKLTGIKNSVE
jgi:RNA polymerase sigma factor (sigma-70 family)